jgi:hypothetical protein
MSSLTSGFVPIPGCVKRSPQKSVPVVVSKKYRIPAVRQVRRRLPDELVPTEVECLAVGHTQRLDVHKVADRDHRRHFAADRTGSGRGLEEVRRLPHSSASTCEKAM